MGGREYRMINKLTLLKDLPEYPAGTVFKEVSEPYSSNGTIITRYNISKDGYRIASYLEGEKTWLTDPQWIKREVDESQYGDYSCPKCGKSKWHTDTIIGYNNDNNSDGYGYYFAVFGECVCGFRRRLVSTNYLGKNQNSYKGLDKYLTNNPSNKINS